MRKAHLAIAERGRIGYTLYMQIRRPHTRLHGTASFTLVEMILVMALIGTLMTVAMPAFSKMISGNLLTTAGQTVRNKVDIAHQAAIAKNNPMEVRFYKKDGSKYYTGVGIAEPRVSTTNLIDKITDLPNGVVILEDDSYSQLLAGTNLFSTNATWNNGRTKGEYKWFTFKADGSTSIDLTTRQSYFTLVLERQLIESKGELPPNFITISVDPFTGRTILRRP